MAKFKQGDVAIYQHLTGIFARFNGELANVLSDIRNCDSCKHVSYNTAPITTSPLEIVHQIGPFTIIDTVYKFCALEHELRPLNDSGIEDSVVHGHVIKDDNNDMDISITPKKETV